MEEKKPRFLMRGVKEELFACLARNPPKTMAAMEKTLEIPINALVSETISAGLLAPIHYERQSAQSSERDCGNFSQQRRNSKPPP